jgi:hypothetical protein
MARLRLNRFDPHADAEGSVRCRPLGVTAVAA